MGYFKVLIAMGVAGCATCVAFMVLCAAPVGASHTVRAFDRHHAPQARAAMNRG